MNEKLRADLERARALLEANHICTVKDLVYDYEFETRLLERRMIEKIKGYLKHINNQTALDMVGWMDFHLKSLSDIAVPAPVPVPKPVPMTFEDFNVENSEYFWPMLERANQYFQLEPDTTTKGIVDLLNDDYRSIRMMDQTAMRAVLFSLERDTFQDMIHYATNRFHEDAEKDGAEQLVHYLVSSWSDRVHSTVD
jgi:hypothetical protein